MTNPDFAKAYLEEMDELRSEIAETTGVSAPVVKHSFTAEEARKLTDKVRSVSEVDKEVSMILETVKRVIEMGESSCTCPVDARLGVEVSQVLYDLKYQVSHLGPCSRTRVVLQVRWDS